MKHHDFTWQRVDATNEGRITCLIVPGLDGSGPGHWRTLWEASRTDCQRADPGDWSDPHPDSWRQNLDRAVSRAAGPVILVAHSLGCLAAAWWTGSAAPHLVAKVRGALLVAPPDVERPDADPRLARFAPTPLIMPSFPTIMVASENDPYASLSRSRDMAAAWRAEFVNLGEAGHINAASRLGAWPTGQALLEDLLYRSRTAPRLRAFAA